MLGFLFTSLHKFRAEKRFGIFSICFVLMSICMIMLPVSLHFPLMAFFTFLTGFGNAILNSFLGAVLQMTVPQDMRGKVFGLLSAIAGGLNPVAFAVGGILAEFIPVRLLISGSFVVTLFLYVPLFLSKPFRAYINFNSETQSISDLT
jgi:MFS family permease